jgi:maleate cis-trans isomerase
LFTGESIIAGTSFATKIIDNEKKDAKIPAITTSLAFFFP